MHETAQAASLGCGPGWGVLCGDAPPWSLCPVSLRAGGIGCVGRDRGQVRKCPGRGGDLQPGRRLLERGGPRCPRPCLGCAQLHQRGAPDGKPLRLAGASTEQAHGPGDTATGAVLRGGGLKGAAEQERRRGFWPRRTGIQPGASVAARLSELFVY